MRAATGKIMELWADGGPFVGDDAAPNGFVTIELGWQLEEWTEPLGDYHKVPVRWFALADSSQVETVIPNVVSVTRTESIDQDAWTVAVVVANQQMPDLGEEEDLPFQLGVPGWFSPGRGETAEAQARWGQTQNAWANEFTQYALIRTYEGYGGHGKTLEDAVADGDVVRTGTWLLDDPAVSVTSSDGDITLTGRNMAALLLDQKLYPPLVPRYDDDGCLLYPLRYSRWAPLTGSGVDPPGIPYGDHVSAGRYIVGIAYGLNNTACSPATEGYWLSGDDGGVFTLGYIPFFGSQAGLPLNLPIVGMTPTASGHGYWLVATDGGVFSFGDAAFYGSVPGDLIDVTNIVDIERSQGGAGYIILGADGGVYCYGDAVFEGSGVGTITGSAVGLAVCPTGGYWMANGAGEVYSFGCSYHGGEAGADFVDIETSDGGAGYYLLRDDGAIYTFGDADYHGSPAEDGITLNDPAVNMAVHPNGGYWIAAADGGVFTYGPGMAFYGSLPGPHVNQGDVDGNLLDVVDLVKDVLLWSGFWLNDGGLEAGVHGNLEYSGTAPLETIGEGQLDKRPPIDAIILVRDILGYTFWVDADGAAHFDSGNLWEPGNYLLSGAQTNVIPDVDEALQLSSYAETRPTGNLFSEVILANVDPEGGYTDATVTRFTPASRPQLRGLIIPGFVPVDVSVTPAQQQVMAEMIDQQITIKTRRGSATMWANPLLNPSDQVRVYERQTGATDIQFIRSMTTTLTLATGEYTQQLDLSWLGNEGEWGVVRPSAVALPSVIEGGVTFPSPAVSASWSAAASAAAATGTAETPKSSSTASPPSAEAGAAAEDATVATGAAALAQAAEAASESQSASVAAAASAETAAGTATAHDATVAGGAATSANAEAASASAAGQDATVPTPAQPTPMGGGLAVRALGSSMLGN